MPARSEPGLTRRSLLGRGAAIASAALVSPASVIATTGKPNKTPADDPARLFRSPDPNIETLFALGGASYGTAEIGEVLELVRRVNARTGDPAEPTTRTFDVLVDEWAELARRLERAAKSALAAGHAVTARDRFLRASTYYDEALFFVLGTSRPGREREFFRACQRNWLAAVSLWQPAPVRLTIRAGDLHLPALLFRPDASGARRRTYIICNGSDGQNVEAVGMGLAAGLARGWNVLVFEGPGQMSLLFERGIPFRADWAPILRAITRTLAARDDVDPRRIAACGISFLGMVLASAAADGSGLAAVVLEPGADSYPAAWGDQAGMKTVIAAQNAPAREKAAIRAELNAGFLAEWPRLPDLARFTVRKRGEIFSAAAMNAARRGQPPPDYFGLLEAMLPFQYEDALRRIAIPTLVTQNADDQFFQSQSKRAFTLIPPGRKRLVDLTKAIGAEFHDQPVGARVAQELIFDWLDGAL